MKWSLIIIAVNQMDVRWRSWESFYNLKSIEETVVIYKSKTELNWTESGQPVEAGERGNNDNKNQ